MADADLKIVLLAGDTEVATSADSGLWLKTMAAIKGIGDISSTPSKKTVGSDEQVDEKQSAPTSSIANFAAELGVAVDELDGACSPSEASPYISLDHHYWEALKQNTPARGVGAIPGVVLAATLLLLWSRHLGGLNVTPTMARDVLATTNVEEKNQARSLKRCDWIQVKDAGLRLNPAQVAKAKRLATAYVERTPV